MIGYKLLYNSELGYKFCFDSINDEKPSYQRSMHKNDKFSIVPQNFMSTKNMSFIGKYWLPYNQILKLTQHSTKESQLYSSTLWNYIEMKIDYIQYNQFLEFITY